MIIYKIINRTNGKIYIGKTTFKLEKRWKEHCKNKSQVISRAIKKYGKENFTIEVIDSANSVEELNQKEQLHIESFGSFVDGYNCTAGGDGGTAAKRSEETKQKLRNSRKEFLKKNSDYSQKGNSNFFYGCTHSDNTKRKMSEKKKGKRLSEDHAKNIGKSRIGKVSKLRGSNVSEDHKLKVSLALGSRPFNVYRESTGELVGTWINRAECARELKLVKGHIGNCLKGKEIHHKGFVFKYEETLDVTQ